MNRIMNFVFLFFMLSFVVPAFSASKNKMDVQWVHQKSSADKLVICGKEKKPLFPQTELAYDLNLSSPVVTQTYKLSHLASFQFYKCENKKWIDAAAPAQLSNFDIQIAVASLWTTGQTPKPEDIKDVKPIKSQTQTPINLSLGKLFDKDQQGDYREGFTATLRLKFFLAPKNSGKTLTLAELQEVSSFLSVKYKLNIGAEVNTSDVEEDVDPAHAHYCGESVLPEGLIRARNAANPDETDGKWFYRTSDLMIENTGKTLRVQYRLYAVECKQRESDKKHYWETVAFPEKVEAFVGRFDGFFSGTSFHQGSGLDQNAILKRYIEMSNKSHGLLAFHEVSPVLVALEIPVQEVMTDKSFNEFQNGAVVPVQLALGIRSPYRVIPGWGLNGYPGVMDFKPYPFFKSDFYLQKNSREVIRPIPVSMAHKKTVDNFALVKKWESKNLEAKAGTNAKYAWDRFEIELYKNQDQKLWQIQLNSRAMTSAKKEIVRPLSLGIYSTVGGVVDLRQMGKAKNAKNDLGPWANYEAGKLVLSRAVDLPNGEKLIYRLELKADPQLNLIESAELRMAKVEDQQSSGATIIEEWWLLNNWQPLPLKK